MRRVAVVLPTAWDRRQLAACAESLRDRFTLVELGPADADVPWDFDVEAFVREAAARHRGELHGVFSSSDYPGAQLAAALAHELGLPGPAPGAVLAASHKLHSRSLQQRVAPTAVPAFVAVDPDRPEPWPWPGPAFVKPVKGTFSMHAALVLDFAALRAHLQRPQVRRYRQRWLRPWQRLQQRHAPGLPPADHFLCEQVLHGQLVTVEGFCHGASAHTLGVVDSRVHPVTGSFEQFDFPSALPAAAQQRCAELAAAVAAAHGLRDTFFNVELFWDAAQEHATVVELNPRLCGQFADLYQKVLGVNSYELALRLACGEDPGPARGSGAFRAATSVPLRVYAPCRVTAAPDAAAVAALERSIAGLQVWSECRAGDELADFASEDGASMRYAVLNLGGRDRAAVAALAQDVRERLGYAFAPLPRC